MNRGPRPYMVDEVFARLAEVGPCTMLDLREEFKGMSRSSIEKYLHILRRAKRIRIYSWVKCEFQSRNYPRPLWSVTLGRDRTKPKALTPAQKNKKYRERLKRENLALVKAKRKARYLVNEKNSSSGLRNRPVQNQSSAETVSMGIV